MTTASSPSTPLPHTDATTAASSDTSIGDTSIGDAAIRNAGVKINASDSEMSSSVPGSVFESPDLSPHPANVGGPSAAAGLGLDALPTVLAGLLFGVVSLCLIAATIDRPPGAPRLLPRRDWSAWVAALAIVLAVAGLCVVALQRDRGTGLLVLIVLGFAAAAVDEATTRLPDPLTSGIAVTAVALATTDSLISMSLEPLTRAASIAAVVGAFAWLLKRLLPAIIGWGDVKLLIGLAATLGWWHPHAIANALWTWPAGIVLAAILASASPARRVVPYGPALMLGALAAIAITH